jgi:hypothetical protein
VLRDADELRWTAPGQVEPVAQRFEGDVASLAMAEPDGID